MKTKTEICVLSDGRRVKYRIDKRKGRPYYFVYFDGPDGNRKELSTQETSLKRAADSAIAVIRQEFQPQVYFQTIVWDVAIEKIVKRMKASNLRPNSVTTYLSVLQTLRDTFPKAHGPGSITPTMAKEYKERRMEAGTPPSP